MEKAIILHGTSGKSHDQWFQWLRQELEKKGFKVWVPDLPGADSPDINVYNKFILENCPFLIDTQTLLVGHSSGAVEAFGLAQVLPNKLGAIISVAGFVDDLNYEPVKHMFQTWDFDWEKIKLNSLKTYAIYSDDDPYVPVYHADKLFQLVGAIKILIKGQKHFSISANPEYEKFPKLLDLIVNI